MVQPPAGLGLSGPVRGRDQCQDPGQTGREPSDQRRDGPTADGHRNILGIWAGDGGEGAMYWLSVFTDLKDWGVDDVPMLVCDG
ncbi:hypothetical protein GCM10010348_70850 [Streptomyces anthocyanicus]|nr:hypothetical protein GCM10010348_70850 [Streptomyces anthocyanicus]